jgi:phosphatidylserine/phosphatidylglycerophosphate/cardiolipin synthase-like enzyme
MKNIYKHLAAALFVLLATQAQANVATKTPSGTENVNETEINVCFTPDEDCQGKIVGLISKAHKKIYVQAYSFTNEQIANALIDAHKRKIEVNILLDKGQLNATNSKYNNVKNAGVNTKIDYKPAIAHNKIIIIDDVVVITGSYNFTNAAQERNAENVLFVYNRQLAGKYLANWRKRSEASK